MSAQPCCPDCSPQCQLSGLARQTADLGDGWWGQPFDDGINTQAAIFWGDECCAECSWCPDLPGR